MDMEEEIINALKKLESEITKLTEENKKLKEENIMLKQKIKKLEKIIDFCIRMAGMNMYQEYYSNSMQETCYSNGLCLKTTDC